MRIETLSQTNKVLVNTLIKHYSIQSIAILSDQNVYLENYFRKSIRKNVTFEIHTKDEIEKKLYINTDNNELLFIIANNFSSFENLLIKDFFI